MHTHTHTHTHIYCRAYGDYMRRGSDFQLDLLDYKSVTHLQPSLLQLQLTLTTESQLLPSLFRAQDLLQTQLALTGHQLTVLPSSALRRLQLQLFFSSEDSGLSQSHVTTDDQSVSKSWIRAPNSTPGYKAWEHTP
jgi:hypothetical protein